MGPCGRDLGPPGGGRSAALAVGALASTRERLVSYPVTGSLEGLAFDLGDGDIVIVGGGAPRRRQRARAPSATRSATTPDAARRQSAGVFRVRSRCPTSLLGPCSVPYRVVVPDNVAVDVRTTSGNVTLRGYRGSARVVTGGGAIDVAGYCGNSLDARAAAGDSRSTPTCAPPRLSLRTSSGSIHAVVPRRPLRRRRREHLRRASRCAG